MMLDEICFSLGCFPSKQENIFGEMNLFIYMNKLGDFLLMGLKIKKTWAITILLGILFCLSARQTSAERTFSPAHRMHSCADFIRVSLHEGITNGRIYLDELEKLDFTTAEDPGFGDNPDYEVFNPKGKHWLWNDRARAQYQEIKALCQYTPPLSLDAVTNVKNTRVILNLRRSVYADGTIKDALMLIIPNIKDKSSCHSGQKDERALMSSVVIASDNHQIVIDHNETGFKAGCIQIRKSMFNIFSEDKIYFFEPILFREKLSGSDVWKYKRVDRRG